jgi:hypothetical protein
MKVVSVAGKRNDDLERTTLVGFDGYAKLT